MARMSNRDRIEKMAAEADATRREKAEKAAKKKAKKKRAPPKKPTPRRKASKRGRVKIVWVVCDSDGESVQVFPYREKAEAEAEVKRRTGDTGRTHMLRSDRVPMEDGE